MTISEPAILDALRTVQEPELGGDLVSRGMVKDLTIDGDRVAFTIELTTPACPLHAYLRQAVDEAVRRHLPEVNSVLVELVWEPPWHPMLISPQARRQLGWTE